MILILSLISALVARSWALSCTQCSSTNTVSCTGSDVTCPSDKSCGSSFTDSNFASSTEIHEEQESIFTKPKVKAGNRSMVVMYKLLARTLKLPPISLDQHDEVITLGHPDIEEGLGVETLRLKSLGGGDQECNFRGGTNIKSVIRTCVLTSECNFTGTLRLKEGHIQLATSCCDKDRCIPNEPKFPAVSTKVNGLVCRSCSSLSSNWCYTSDTVQCTGNEDRCLLQATEIKGSVSTSFRGCATKSLCDLGSQTQTIEGVTTKVKFVCTDGGISVHTAVLAPAIVCLLLLNFLF
ncbi:uncharacterized protein [Engystomops pustulosus]|uniref:uncharacterized protein n=1 Tax=Engystomops pustulosus TaxID=76066 RepID=UPI003AFA516B